jgi:hypothetical protein
MENSPINQTYSVVLNFGDSSELCRSVCKTSQTYELCNEYAEVPRIIEGKNAIVMLT